MRIAHADRRGRAERAGRQVQAKRVGLRGQRDAPPVEGGLAHVDTDPPGPGARCLEAAGLGVQPDRIGAGLRHDQPGDAAARVAASLDLAAIGVVDGKRGIRSGLGWRFDDDQLVEADAAAAVGQRAHGIGRQGPRHETRCALPCVDDHEVVAEPVHLDEFGAVHHSANIAERARMSTANDFDSPRPGRETAAKSQIVPGDVVVKFGVGQPVPRTEDPRFLKGQGQYVDDITLPGQVHGYVLRSPHAHADIVAIDTEAASRAPGVLLVMTNADIAAEGIAGVPHFIPPMAFGAPPP